jgi:hypothetical protein
MSKRALSVENTTHSLIETLWIICLCYSPHFGALVLSLQFNFVFAAAGLIYSPRHLTEREINYTFHSSEISPTKQTMAGSSSDSDSGRGAGNVTTSSSGGEDAIPGQLAGLLTRLDDKLDALQAANRLSRPQLQEEEYVRGSAGSSSAASGSAAASSADASVAAARRGPRQPLAGAIKDLNCQWSEGFFAMAKEGDSACMFIIAQMLMAPKGYGSLPHDRARGLNWLWKAIEAGDIEARAYARRGARSEFMRYLALKELDAEAADKLSKDEKALADAMENMALKEVEVEKEEKRILAERDAEFGE